MCLAGVAPKAAMMKSLDNQAIIPYLDEVYLEQLAYLDVQRPKLLVVFSGGNAVGKSSLAAVLKDHFQALVLENDAVRGVLLEYEPELVHDRERLGNAVWRYMQDLCERMSQLTSNGLVIRDAVIDWHFEKILPLFSQQGYELFIVRFEVSREKRQELLAKRSEKQWISNELLAAQFDQYDVHSARFLAAYTPDIILTDETMFDYDTVIEALQKKLQRMNSKILF